MSKRRGRFTPFLNDEPQLLAEWHPTKNLALDPMLLGRSSLTKVWWRCAAGHSWRTTVLTRVRGSGCPVCARRRAVPRSLSLAATHPKLSKEWDQAANGDLTPWDVTYGQKRQVAWKCPRNPEHRWKTSIAVRSRGHGCPFCVNQRVPRDQSLSALHPGLARELRRARIAGQNPEKIAPGSQKLLTWQCAQGHRWQATPKNRVAGRGCPQCFASKPRRPLSRSRPDIAAQWHPTANQALTPDDVPVTSRVEIVWRCDAGHDWVAQVASLLAGATCLECRRQQRKAS